MLVYVCEETVDSLLFLCHAANKLASLLRGEGRMGFRDIHPYWEIKVFLEMEHFWS